MVLSAQYPRLTQTVTDPLSCTCHSIQPFGELKWQRGAFSLLTVAPCYVMCTTYSKYVNEVGVV